MYRAGRPLHHHSPLNIVFVITLLSLVVASAFLVRGVVELFGVNTESLLGPWRSLGFR